MHRSDVLDTATALSLEIKYAKSGDDLHNLWYRSGALSGAGSQEPEILFRGTAGIKENKSSPSQKSQRPADASKPQTLNFNRPGSSVERGGVEQHEEG